ncbi:MULTISPECIES: hypothetical protein [Chryseobacterium]|uniref:Serine endopeptidase n=1 Tax=Chryseobacterium camelliae TaxID=1265445 RepID=A0ABU0THZ0_9FLAO|nr:MULTISPECIES: hypothetical protein [Chryseobacterium]MDT3409464.1 hypothetical protein [Pseudacidovorax intermedius]MDQ1096671.1 hypothetical protein [Chryseobacterium camelliae]MDQ1100615.1 hypothetical protein [Chryseobacterium sp. SORGH_AS_1048]MDR6087953.1 hypothetical protein [Chryseobacterium sp. SORGH_AS_0909]MDR6132327.1 hypothetical protein [Chryseobacterium sp. SORGH_AS_1175]
MKSLKEFIAENLENPTVTTIQENTEKLVEENSNQETVEEGAKSNEDITKKD